MKNIPKQCDSQRDSKGEVCRLWDDLNLRTPCINVMMVTIRSPLVVKEDSCFNAKFGLHMWVVHFNELIVVKCRSPTRAEHMDLKADR